MKLVQLKLGLFTKGLYIAKVLCIIIGYKHYSLQNIAIYSLAQANNSLAGWSLS